jgi:hypothetical protein
MAEISQDLGGGFALRQAKQTTAFLGLTAAVFCGVHAIAPRNGYRPFYRSPRGGSVPSISGAAGPNRTGLNESDAA